MSKKPFTFRSSTQQQLDNMQRDFRMATEKQPMITVGELSNEQGKEYSKRLFSFLEKCIKNTPHHDFFIEVHRWHEIADRCVTRYRLRQLMILPTPRPGRGYFEYNHETGELDLLWDLPPEKACKWAMKNKYTASLDVPAALKTIMDYYDGTLERRVNEINESIAQKERKK